jgi:hypothetical protein
MVLISSNFDSRVTGLVKENFALDFSLGLGLNRKMNYFPFDFVGTSIESSYK